MNHGLLLIDKPIGITSHDVVARLRRVLKTKSIGHAGTLDPMASGLMVCLVNEGTKLSNYILEKDKSYRVGVQFGVRSDTLDSAGSLKYSNASIPPADMIIQAAQQLQGDLDLEVPLFSAKKIDGKKLYEYAREKQEVVIPRKLMRFWDIKAESTDFDNRSDAEYVLTFLLTCSKGSFVRAWASTLGERLRCGAIVKELRRLRSTPYSVNQAVSLEDFEKIGREALRGKEAWIDLPQALPGFKDLWIQGMDESLIQNGQISHDLRLRLISAFDPERDHIIKVHSRSSGRLLSLIGLEPKKGFFIRRVFNYGIDPSCESGYGQSLT